MPTDSNTTSADIPYVRERMRTVSSQPVRVEIETPVPKVVRTYYSAASMVDRHNRCRQDDLQIEKSFETKDWSMRVNMTLFGMIVVNSWLLYKGSMGGRQKISQSEFYLRLADGLIDNNYDSARTRQKNKVCEENDANSLVDGTGIHLQPTNKRRKNTDESISNAEMQQRCKFCHKKTKYTCSECGKGGLIEIFLCHSESSRRCFEEHLAACHRLSCNEQGHLGKVEVRL